MASTMTRSTHVMSARTASFWARRTVLTFASITASESVISSSVCCIATCAIIPAAPANTAGLATTEPGPLVSWTMLLMPPAWPFACTTPVLRPVLEI